MPFFSVIIPTYNRSSELIKAVQSLQEQQYGDLEIIIVDDGSTDDTRQRVADFHGIDIRYHYQDNGGVCLARNQGASLATGKYLVFLDSDDLLVADALSNYHQVLFRTSASIAFGDMELVDSVSGRRTKIPSRNPYGNVNSNGIYIPGTFCISRELFFSAGGYDPRFKYGENTELKFRIEKLKPSFIFTDKVAVIYNQSSDGGSKNLKNLVDSNQLMIEKHQDVFARFPMMEKNYRQAIAIAQCRMGDYSGARIQMRRALRCHPTDLKVYFRLLIMFFPFMAKRIWK